MQGDDGRQGGVIMLSSGDNFLAGPVFTVSVQKGVPFYDSQAMELIGYNAIAIGNHEFDFGPDVFADFIEGLSAAPLVSANLDFSGEPRLQALVKAGRIVHRTVVKTNGEALGVVGVTTPQLPFISSLRQVKVDHDVARVVQTEVDSLVAQGINKVILISHLQSLARDLALAPQLRDVDVIVAGGGDELLAQPTTLLLPGDKALQPYPLMTTDATGRSVPVVTTRGG
jgi:5'-nucleotidase